MANHGLPSSPVARESQSVSVEKATSTANSDEAADDTFNATDQGADVTPELLLALNPCCSDADGETTKTERDVETFGNMATIVVVAAASPGDTGTPSTCFTLTRTTCATGMSSSSSDPTKKAKQIDKGSVFAEEAESPVMSI